MRNKKGSQRRAQDTCNLHKGMIYRKSSDFIFLPAENPEVKKICTVLAGYVWNEENSFVKKHDNVIANMAYLLNMQKEQSPE